MIVQSSQPNERRGLDVVLPGDAPVEVSERWTVGGWDVQFVRLQRGATIALDHSAGTMHLKVITGSLAEPSVTPFAPAGAVRDTAVAAPSATSGPEGALFTILTETPQVPGRLADMEQLAFSGPHADRLGWQSFYERFRGAEVFAGLDAHMAPGFHVLDRDGDEIVYLNFWTMGKGGDASDHDHSRAPAPTAPAFAEIHWVFQNGTGRGGMYVCDGPGQPRTPIVMARGHEHGPLWTVDTDTGLPERRDNGAVHYGWHGWEAGTDDQEGQSYDFVAAFEINPDLAPVTAG